MPFTDAELSQLGDSHDIINLGMLADEARARLHDKRTTFVRVHLIPAEADSFAVVAGAGEVRLEGVPASRAAAVDRVTRARAASGDAPLSAYSLADLEQL